MRPNLAFPESLFAAWEDALLFRTLATLRGDVPVFSSIDDLLWRGAAEKVIRDLKNLLCVAPDKRLSSRVRYTQRSGGSTDPRRP